MTISLQRFATSDTNYIAKHNSNADTLESAIATLETGLSGVSGLGALSIGTAFEVLFGSTVAVIGSGSYLPSGASSTLTVAAGYAWIPSQQQVLHKASSTALSFSGLTAATYYVVLDATGTPTRSASSTDALYSVVWDGAAFGTITRLANIAWAYSEWSAAQTSTALGASYTTLDARLEAGEALIKDAELQAIAGLTSANNKIPYFTGSGTAALLTRDTDGTLAANSDTNIATQKAVKTYVDSAITGGAADVMIFKGVIDCSTNPNYPAADAGHVYKVSVAGKIGGASGVNVEVGDTLYCITDGSAAGTQAAVGANWVIVQLNIDGAVVGPASSTDSNIALFNGSTGRTLKDGGPLVFDISAFYPGIPSASAIVVRIPIARAVTFAANFAGSYFAASANATATTVFDVTKNGSSIGSISIAAGGTTATFTTSGGTSKSFAAGDVLAIVSPATPDATLANPGFTLAGTR